MNKQALKLIDNAITQISGRELVSSSEMTDLLLDIRLHLMIQEELNENTNTKLAVDICS